MEITITKTKIHLQPGEITITKTNTKSTTPNSY